MASSSARAARRWPAAGSRRFAAWCRPTTASRRSRFPRRSGRSSAHDRLTGPPRARQWSECPRPAISSDASRCSVSSLLAGLAVVALFAPPEDKKEAAAVKEKAEEVCQLFLKGDFAKFVDLTHPTVVKEAGGRDKMIDLLT